MLRYLIDEGLGIPIIPSVILQGTHTVLQAVQVLTDEPDLPDALLLGEYDPLGLVIVQAKLRKQDKEEDHQEGEHLPYQ